MTEKKEKSWKEKTSTRSVPWGKIQKGEEEEQKRIQEKKKTGKT